MINRFCLIILLFLSVLSFNSFAAFPVPYATGYHLSRSIAPDMGTYSSLADLEAYILDYTFSNPAASAPYSFSYSGSLSAVGDVSGLNFTYLWGGSQYNTTKYTVRYVSYLSCPANSSPSGSQCICNSGYEEKNGNSCELPKPPDACEKIDSTCSSFKNDRIPRFDVYYSGSAPGGACSNPPLDGCSKGCYLQFTGISVYYKDHDGRSIASGAASFTGDSCVHSEESGDPDPDKSCKSGEFPGTVNGKKVCIPAVEKETDHQPKTENKADGSTSETKSTVSCSNGKCTVTETTTTKDANGNVTGKSTNTTVYSESDFCQKNPASGVCSGSGSGSGSGNGSGTGNGDGEDGNGPGGTGSATHEKWEVPKIYESKYPDGIASAYEESGLKEASGIFDGLVNAFVPKFSDSNGACQNFSISLNMGIVNFGTFDISPPCILWPFLWLVVQLTAIFTFRALVFGG